MANHVIRDLVSEIKGGFFSIPCDEFKDISNKEQLTMCIRWVDKELEAHGDFLRFTMYNVQCSALSGKRVACLTKDVLQKMGNDTSFRSFYDVVLLKSKTAITA